MFGKFQKIIFLSVLIFGFFSVAPFAHATITVSAPSAGTSWQAGTIHTISWTGGGSWVTRILLNTPTSVVLTVATNLSNTGSYSWAIPTSVTPATNYLIYVETAPCNGCAASDWVYGPQFTITAAASNAAFISQTPPPSTMTTGQTAIVLVTMQNTGGDTWVQGSLNPYRLGSQNPQDNNTWGLNRVNLPMASVAPGASATFTFTVTAPSIPGTYNFQWRMVQEGIAWFGAYSTNAIVTVTAPDTTPPVISAVSASGITTNSATITWTTNENADSLVEYGLTSAYGSTVFNTSLVTSHSIGLSGLSAGTLYHYRVRSRDAALNTSYSPDATFTTTSAPDTTPPTPPTMVSMGSATQNSLTVTWSGATDNVAVTGYRLDVSTSAAFSSFVLGYNNLDVGNVTSQLISGLNPSTTYYARVRAYDAAGNISSNSVTASGATTAPPPPPNVSGYAWAGSGEGVTDAAIKANPGIGWISLSCANAGNCASTGNYGVNISSASPGVLSGYAWVNPNDGAQNNIGWISFNTNFDESGTLGCPSNLCTASLDRGTGQVSGWARACVVFANGCSGALRPSSDLGGWDGWIHLRGTASDLTTYGVSASGCNWSGYAWGGGGIPGSGSPLGWIHFGGALYPVTGTGDGCASSGSIIVSATSNGSAWPGSGTASVNYSISGPTAIASANSVPITYSNLSSGSYSLAYSSGGPAGGTLASISPCGAGINPCSQTIPGGGGSISFILNFNVPPSPPPSVSMTVSPQNACKVVNVLWGSSIGATGYNAQRCGDAGCSGVPIPACSALAPATSCTDTTAPDGIPFWYRVSAYNAFGNSAWAYSASSITNNAPDVSFSYTPSSNIVINQLVKFAGQLLGGSATTSQSWTFAGGNPPSSTNPSPSSRFATSGSHAVTYTANNASGSCVVSGSVSISQNTFGDWCELPPDAPPGTACP